MKITVNYTETTTDNILNIENASYIGDFVMRLKFNTGEEKLVDFKPFLKSSYHPAIKKFLDEKQFSHYQIINGNLNWNNYELIFPINDLYTNTILKT